MLGSLLCLLTGTMLGMLIRSSAGALVAYFVYSLLLPTVSGILASSQEWFRDLQPWVDLNYAQSALFEGTLTAEQWANLAVTAINLARPARHPRPPPGHEVRSQVECPRCSRPPPIVRDPQRPCYSTEQQGLWPCSSTSS